MNLVRLALDALTGLLSILLLLHALATVWAIDLRANPFVTYLYCIFPGLMLFIFLWVRPPRMKTAVLWLLAIGYLVTASILNWRTCAELGYCSTVAATVTETLRTKPVLAAFGVAALSLVSLLLSSSQREAERDSKSQ
jgi:hypothetical protein